MSGETSGTSKGQIEVSRQQFIASGATAVASLVPTPTARGSDLNRSGDSRSAFTPGEPWLDTEGKPIQAHGRSIIVLDGKYYWYGENKEFTTGKSNVRSCGIRAYVSQDLYNWKDLGTIIPPDTEDETLASSPDRRSRSSPHSVQPEH